MPPDPSPPVASTLQTPREYREEIRKSRFIVRAAPAATPQAALDFITSVAEPDAGHNCWAYRIGAQYRFNDDGEPGGTAGRPILQAIEGQQCDQVVVAVARWFGGIKLGTGGLARAYGGCAAKCLREAPKAPIVIVRRVGIGCTFAQWQFIQPRLKSPGTSIENVVFGADGVRATIVLPDAQIEPLRIDLGNLSRGQANFQVLP